MFLEEVKNKKKFKDEKCFSYKCTHVVCENFLETAKQTSTIILFKNLYVKYNLLTYIIAAVFTVNK